MTTRPASRLALAAVTGAWVFTVPAYAGPFDVTPYAEYGVAADNNVFRLTDDEQAQGVTGASQRSDVIQHQRLGVLAEWPMSRQRLEVDGQVSRFDYNRFDRLDHNEDDIRTTLEFEAGPIIHGTARYQTSRQLDDFSNREGVSPDFIRRHHPEVDSYVDITPDWRVHTHAGYLRLDHSLDSQPRFDRRENQGLLALEYRGAGNSLVGVGVEYIDGDYPERRADDVLAPSFENTTAFANLDWDYSDVSTFRFRLGYTTRDNAGRGNRDFGGATGRLRYVRTLTDKTSLSAEFARQIYSVDNVDANFLRQTSGRLDLRWAYSPKLNLVATAARYEQDYQALPGARADARQDTLYEFTGELSYQPYRFIALLVDARNEHRDSSRAGASYDAFVTSLSVRVALDGDRLTLRP